MLSRYAQNWFWWSENELRQNEFFITLEIWTKVIWLNGPQDIEATNSEESRPTVERQKRKPYIKNNAWVTVNNDFFVTSEAIRQWFSRVTKSRVKIIAESPHEWQKIVIHGNECIILFLTRYFMSWTHKSAKNYHRALISPLLPRAAFSDRALWRHNNRSVTSCEREILVLWSHICLLSLHAQVGAKAIFISE